MHYGIQQKLCVCTWLARNGIQNRTRFWLYLYKQRAVHFPPFFLPSLMAPVQNHWWKSVWGEKKCCNHHSFGGREQHFLGPVLPSTCFILCDFADLKHGWITHAFPQARKNGEKRHKKWWEWETYLSTCMVHYRLLHGPIRINVSVSGSTALSMFVHMESCTLHFYCLDYYRSCVCIRIRTNGIAP